LISTEFEISSTTQERSVTENRMVVEWLKFHVLPEQREQFVQQDDEIWTAALSIYAGFLGKEVWISPDDLSEIVLVIRWASFEDWQAVPSDRLQQLETQFRSVMGETYSLLDASRYQIRKFSQVQSL
jgi:uncharacterized protein (TIGR03792 family)